MNPILEKAQAIMLDELRESLSRFDAQRMVGLFFEIPMKNGKTVAQFILDEATIKKEKSE